MTGIIPRKIHVVWVGDEAKRPNSWIETWRVNHPDWEFRLWSNKDLADRHWRAQKQIDIYKNEGQWAGVADLMRYEILYEYGGVYVDADSECLRQLDDWLLQLGMFVAYESERHRPGLIANGFMGCPQGHPVLAKIIGQTSRMCRPTRRWSWQHLSKKNILPWKVTGPRLLTRIIEATKSQDVTILPSILFMPDHFMDKPGDDKRAATGYARHHWGSTHNSY
ncbi:MAG: hypothetical protein JO126_08185 [Alphaproteobacteria bacterium]|nr:hypothetical protein [Alphaproteobacteria bacterium]MBV8549419.1 hypothetical protein [Alphaproteobacteria bacterium]